MFSFKSWAVKSLLWVFWKTEVSPCWIQDYGPFYFLYFRQVCFCGFVVSLCHNSLPYICFFFLFYHICGMLKACIAISSSKWHQYTFSRSWQKIDHHCRVLLCLFYCSLWKYRIQILWSTHMLFGCFRLHLLYHLFLLFWYYYFSQVCQGCFPGTAVIILQSVSIALCWFY